MDSKLLLKFGFSDMEEESYAERGEALVAELSQEQQGHLLALEAYRRQYYEDLRAHLQHRIGIVLRDAENHPDAYSAESIAAQLAVSAAGMALTMSNRFNVPIAEIFQFGQLQGDLPETESGQIIE